MTELPPNLRLEQRVNPRLLRQRISIQQAERVILDIRFGPKKRTAQQPRRHAGSPVVVERFFQTARIKEGDFIVPKLLRRLRQPGPDRAIDRLVALMRTDAKKLEQVTEVTAPDQRELELEHGVLAVVDVDRMDLGRPIEQVVERVATGAGDHDDAALSVESHEFAIDARIFPAGVVDQLPAMDVVKDQVMCGFEETACRRRTSSNSH